MANETTNDLKSQFDKLMLITSSIEASRDEHEKNFIEAIELADFYRDSLKKLMEQMHQAIEKINSLKHENEELKALIPKH